MSDPIELPSVLPLNSFKHLLSFAQGNEKFCKKCIASCLTVAAYGAQFIPIPEDGTTAKAEGVTNDAYAISLLEGLIAAEELGVKTGVIPWEIIVAFAVKKLLEYLSK
jgi:hypothetical protein